MVYLSELTGWKNSFFVDGNERQNATTGISLTVTGSNVAGQASVDYYIEGVASDASGNSFRFLEGTGSAVTVGGSALTGTNETDITSHLEAMGLSTTTSHTIDYYIYAEVTATGAISGEPLISEIPRTLFDSVTYDVATEYTASLVPVNYQCDGHIENGPGGYDYKYDSSYITIGGSNDYRYYGVLEVPITSIPDSADITYMSFKYHGYATITYREFYLTSCPVSPYDNRGTTSAWSVMWNGIDTGPQYSDVVDVIVGSNQEIVLYPAAITDLEALLDSQDWFALGFKCTEFTSSARYEKIYAVDYSSATPKPTVYVEYMAFGASWYNLPPLSIVSMPLAQDVAAVLAVFFAGVVIVRKEKERNK